MTATDLFFRKMHGLGNDFIVLDARKATLSWVLDNPRYIRLLCDRRRGIGCDQLIVMAPSEVATIEMRIFNADGSMAGMCGNASRCLTKLLHDETGKNDFTIAVGKRILTAHANADGEYTVNMGKASFEWQDIPLAREMKTGSIDLTIAGLPLAQAASMGNPHCVLFVQDSTLIPVEEYGPQIEYHPLFPERTNVGFASRVAANTIRLKVWERGAGVTLACGSDACATYALARRSGLVNGATRIIMDGGTLLMNENDDGDIMMTGPATLVVEGTVPASFFG